jgi:hypothetical protein
MFEHNPNAFTGFEMADVAERLPERFILWLDHLDASAQDQLEYLAEGLLGELRTTRSVKEKKLLIAEFISYAIYTGMLIREQRLAIDMVMYRNNTGMDN